MSSYNNSTTNHVFVEQSNTLSTGNASKTTIVEQLFVKQTPDLFVEQCFVEQTNPLNENNC